jgi:hypothetical protein
MYDAKAIFSNNVIKISFGGILSFMSWVQDVLIVFVPIKIYTVGLLKNGV